MQAFDTTPRSLVLAPQPPQPLPSRIDDEQQLARWREEHAEAKQQLAHLERRRRTMLASASVEEIQRTDGELASLRVRIERAAAVIEDAETKFAERAARLKAAEPERRAKHKAAVAARDEAERIVREVYGPAARTIAEALTKLAELEAVIRSAGEPPEGLAPVPSYEAFRHPPEANCRVHIPLTPEVRLPPVVRGEPDIWPRSR